MQTIQEAPIPLQDTHASHGTTEHERPHHWRYPTKDISERLPLVFLVGVAALDLATTNEDIPATCFTQHQPRADNLFWQLD